MTSFFGTCQFVKRAADGRWAGIGTKEKNKTILGLWGRKGVAAMELVKEPMK